MSLIPSLLQAIVSTDGDALVMHVGEKPYVVSPTGQVDLATRGLTFDAVHSIVNHVLPIESQQILEEFGAAQYELPRPIPEFPGEHFTIVAARGGDDVWAEVRRRRIISRPGTLHRWLHPSRPARLSRPSSRSRLRHHSRSRLRRPERPRRLCRSPALVPHVAPAVETPPPAPLIAPAVAIEPAGPEPPQPAVVLPVENNPTISHDVPAPLTADALAGLDRLLRLAATRGASALYLSSAARPSVRVDGDVYETIDGAPVLEAEHDVESLLMTLMPERNAEALRTGVASEWICDVPDVGRVRCLSFRDHRGPGGVFRMMPVRTITADQLGLSREIQAAGDRAPEGPVLRPGLGGRAGCGR